MQRALLRIVTALLAVIATVAPASAAEKDNKDPASGQYINISPVAVPIVLNGQLINYIFVTLRLNLVPNVDALRMREKEPYYRDALVRAAHRTPFVKPGDYIHVNQAMLKASMMSEGARIAGPHVITSVDIINEQPQKVTGLPRPEGPSAIRAPIP
jgi:hypothetical protein